MDHMSLDEYIEFFGVREELARRMAILPGM